MTGSRGRSLGAGAGLIALALVGCDSILGPDFLLDLEADVQRVETVSDSLGTRVSCDVVLTATATGSGGQYAWWGESVWTLRRVSDDSIFAEEIRSPAYLTFLFGADSIAAGASAVTSVSHSAEVPFSWEFAVHYRRLNGSRDEEIVTAVCA